jgi:DNA-binding transcriptional LysR family regulator
MTNIPTELLRTLVAVVDLRSFTRAAQSLNVTQPAVSAQIKRLQGLLGTDLLDKSAPGVTLTSAGELVVNYARRLLSINDQILDLAGPRPTAQTFRIGQTGDFTASEVSLALCVYRARRPELRFVLATGSINSLVKEMREGELDLVVWVSATGPALETRHYWTEELVWLCAPSTRLDPQAPVPLVSYGEECLFTRNALTALSQANRQAEIVYTGSSIAGLGSAVAAGMGIMAFPRRRAALPGVVIWDDAPLPKLPDIFCGVYTRDGTDREQRELVADVIAQTLRAGKNGEAFHADDPVRMNEATPAD